MLKWELETISCIVMYLYMQKVTSEVIWQHCFVHFVYKQFSKLWKIAWHLPRVSLIYRSVKSRHLIDPIASNILHVCIYKKLVGLRASMHNPTNFPFFGQ